jgi:TRAP-type uncharacterized transport system substrate-binding protein
VTRKLAALVVVGMAGVLLSGHSPYRQWYAYRAKHLVVVTDESRPGAIDVATAIAAAIAARWPETRSVAAAARSPAEVVKLLASGQLQVGLVPAGDALEATEGRGLFATVGKVPLRAIARIEGDLLVVLESCADEQASAIAQALAESRAGGPLAHKALLRGSAPIPFHPGALGFYGSPGFRDSIRK